VHVNRLTERLSRRDDIELHVVTFGDESREFKEGNLSIHMVRRIKLPLTPFSLSVFRIGSLRRSIEVIKPALVHAQGSFVPYSTAASLVGKRYPTVLTVHAPIAEQWRFSGASDILYSFLLDRTNERYVVSRIPDIITVSPHVRDVIRGMSCANIRVVPNGVEYEDIQNAKLSKSLKSPSVLYVGNLRKVKGVDILLAAIPLVKRTVGDIHVYLAGAGPQEKELRKLAERLHIAENIEFLGFIEGEEKYSYYKAADICVFPSRQESFGMGLLEAMASKKAVVASNVGGIPSIVADGESGLLFQCGDIGELAGKMVTLLQSRELRQTLGLAGWERARLFTWDRVAERTVEVYREVIADFQRGHSVAKEPLTL